MYLSKAFRSQRFTLLLSDLIILLLVKTVEVASLLSLDKYSIKSVDSDVAPGMGFEPMGS